MPLRSNVQVHFPGDRGGFVSMESSRKVRTLQGGAPCESEGRVGESRFGRKVQQKKYRFPPRRGVRVKRWGKSPPLQRQLRRHGKPRVVQDRTGEGLPARRIPGY